MARDEDVVAPLRAGDARDMSVWHAYKVGIGRPTHLENANLQGTSIHGIYFVEVDMPGDSLAGAYLSRADLYGANLTWADLTGANLDREYLLADGDGHPERAGSAAPSRPVTK
jgi:hypothetical protein